MLPSMFSLKGLVFFSVFLIFSVRTAFKGYHLPTSCKSTKQTRSIIIRKSVLLSGISRSSSFPLVGALSYNIHDSVHSTKMHDRIRCPRNSKSSDLAPHPFAKMFYWLLHLTRVLTMTAKFMSKSLVFALCPQTSDTFDLFLGEFAELDFRPFFLLFVWSELSTSCLSRAVQRRAVERPYK